MSLSFTNSGLVAGYHKKITSITLANCRAYCIDEYYINLPNGDNLLIYGENGSGKSSLFKALSNYFSKSVNSNIEFVKNRHFNNLPGFIKLTFADFDRVTKSVLNSNIESYSFGSDHSENLPNYIKVAALIKGFLDYSNLLEVYLYSDKNLFNLITLNLLADQLPLRSGGSIKFKENWDSIQNKLVKKSRNRNSKEHKLALIELNNFHIQLHSTLTAVFVELNRLLNEYFKDFNINLNFNLPAFTFEYGPKHNWKTIAELNLIVIKDNIDISDNYRDTLNEARLSAISICLYLASLKENPDYDLKLIYLDDVFIGLDAGNRLPILDILDKEFNDYQIIISTYDRHWFELAKRRFSLNAYTSWKPIEFFVGQHTTDNITYSKPIIIESESHYDRAVQYLHNRIKPDYPAAANYFRKALEELISSTLPKWELADNNYTQIPEYKLSKLCQKLKKFLNKIGTSDNYINTIITFLPSLLHPLSHHEISSQIYKSELLMITEAFASLKKQITDLDLMNNYVFKLNAGTLIKLIFEVNATDNHFCYYELKLKEALIYKRISNNSFEICSVECNVTKLYGNNGKKKYPTTSINKNNPLFQYSSLKEACDKIHAHLIKSPDIGHFDQKSNYIDQIHFFKDDSYQPLNSIRL